MFVRNNRIRTFLSIEHTPKKKMCMKISSTRVKKGLMTAQPVNERRRE